MENKSKTASLTKGPVAKTLVNLTFPMVLGIAGMIAFNLIDTFFIAKLGTVELAAISFTFPVVLIVSSISLGLGIGASTVIARAIGDNNYDKVKRVTTDSLLLSFSIVLVFVVAGFFTIKPLFNLMGATASIMPLIEDYMNIWYIGMVFVVIPMIGNSAIRATGDTKTPTKIMYVAISVNMILDPLLIFGLGPFPRMELKGAALATVIARAVTLFASIWVLYFREKMITLTFPAWKKIFHSWKEVLYVGIPAAATNLILPISLAVITKLIALYGPHAVAAFGIASKIEAFALTIIIALSSVLAPFVGQNSGAGKINRVATGIRLSSIFAMLWGLVIWLIFIATAKPIAALFNDHPIIINLVNSFLLIVGLSYGFQGVLMLSNSAFNALNKPLPAITLSTIRLFLLYIPLALLGSAIFKLEGVFMAAAIANTMTGATAWLWLKKNVIRLKEEP